jgi:hypothetical protein
VVLAFPIPFLYFILLLLLFIIINKINKKGKIGTGTAASTESRSFPCFQLLKTLQNLHQSGTQSKSKQNLYLFFFHNHTLIQFSELFNG